MSLAPINLASVQLAAVNFSASGDNTLVAAVAGKLIQLVRIFVVVAAATNLTFKDGTGGTALSGPIPMAANGSITLDIAPVTDFPWYSTSNVANNLVLNSSAAVQVSGTIWYSQV